MSKIFAFLPWRIFIPIILITGLAVTVWGGIFLMTTAITTWERDKAAHSNEEMARLEGRWNHFVGEINNTRALLEALNTKDNFVEMGQQIKQQFPALNAILFINQQKRQHLQYLLQSELSANDGAKILESVTDLPEITILTAKQRANLLPFLDKDLKSDNIQIVATAVTGENAKGLILALVDMPALISASLKTTADGSTGIAISLADAKNHRLVEANITERFSKELADFKHIQTVHWNSGNWQIKWFFDQSAASKPQFLPGIILIALGIGLTIAFAGVILTQNNVSRQVKREVAERTKEIEEVNRRFRLITNNAYDLIAIITPDGKFEYTNSAYHRSLGYGHEELKGHLMVEYVHPDDNAAFTSALSDLVSGRNNIEINFSMRNKSGGWLSLEAIGRPMHDSDWGTGNIVIHCRDVTAKKQATESLTQSEQRFRDFSESSADWLWEVDRAMNFTFVSRGVVGVLGYQPEDLVNKVKFDELFDDSGDPTRDLIETRIRRKQAYRDIEFWTRSSSGDRVCLRISGVPVLDENQIFRGYRGAATNITSSKVDRDNMFRLANTDHLTGLLNRLRFSEELERSLSLSRRHKTRGVVMFIDLDRFKEINDTHGHEAGDAILKAVSNILKTSLRNTDIIARLGGDEFAVIMPNTTVEDARKKVNRIIDEIAELRVEYKGAKLNVTMSIGMISYPQEDKSATDLIMAADLSMYRAKDMGRNRVFVDEGGDGSTDGSDSVRAQLKWVEILRKSLNNGDFEMYFQPIIPVTTQPRPLVEALLRLHDENGKLGSPALFIDAAEHFGLIQQLDLSVLERCIATQVALAKQGREVDMTINLSGRSLGDPEVVSKLHEVVKKYDLNPKNFILEVTETAALHDPSAWRDIDVVAEFLRQLRGMGFNIAIDDFGSGFSSFSYLRKLEIDILKIDGEFVKNIDNDATDRMFLQALVSLAKGLNIKTIAEFVENEAVLKILRDTGVDYAQGYLLSRPHPDLAMLCDNFKGKNMNSFMTGAKDDSPKVTVKKAKPKVSAAAKKAAIKKVIKK